MVGLEHVSFSKSSLGHPRPSVSSPTLVGYPHCTPCPRVRSMLLHHKAENSTLLSPNFHERALYLYILNLRFALYQHMQEEARKIDLLAKRSLGRNCATSFLTPLAWPMREKCPALSEACSSLIARNAFFTSRKLVLSRRLSFLPIRQLLYI